MWVSSNLGTCTPPGRALRVAPTPLQGANPVARQSRFHGFPRRVHGPPLHDGLWFEFAVVVAHESKYQAARSAVATFLICSRSHFPAAEVWVRSCQSW